jgi:hypothetical protein
MSKTVVQAFALAAALLSMALNPAVAEGPRRLLLAAPAGGQGEEGRLGSIRLTVGGFFPVNEAEGSNPCPGYGIGLGFPFGYNDCGNFLFSLTYACFMQDGDGGYSGGGGGGGYGGESLRKGRSFGTRIGAGTVEMIYPMVGYLFNIGESRFYAGPSIGGAIAHNDAGGSDFSFAYSLTAGYNFNRFFVEAQYLRGAASTQSGFQVSGGIRF